MLVGSFELGLAADIPEEEDHASEGEEDDQGQEEAEEAAHGGTIAGWEGGVNGGSAAMRRSGKGLPVRAASVG